MDLDQETQICEYTLNILSVKMQVNFPCKMKVQHNSTSLTTQVTSYDTHKFVFNQQVSIRQQVQRQSFQLQVSLVTQKGAKYTAGIVKLYHSELAKLQGQMMVVALARCLDKQAFCEIKVEQVIMSKLSQRQTFGRANKVSQLPFFDGQDQSPTNNRAKTATNYNMAAETKSQFRFPLNNQHRSTNEWDNKSRQATSHYQQNVCKLANTRPNLNKPIQKSLINRNKQSSRDQYTFQLQDQLNIHNRDKLIEAQVYKQGYLKLKEKYKKQAQTVKNQLNKRMELQNSQNALKLEVMKYKLKSDQLERVNVQKSAKIKDLQNQTALLQQKQMELQFFKESQSQKDRQTRVLQDTIRQISHQNQELQALIQNRYSSQSQKIAQLRHQIQSLKSKYESVIQRLQKQTKCRDNELSLLQKQLSNVSSLLQQERRVVNQAQNTLKSKRNEFDKVIENQKSSHHKKVQQLKQKIQKQQRQLSDRQNAFKQLNKQNQKHKTATMKLQYDKRILTQDNQSLRTQHLEMKAYREKYNQMFRQHRFLIQEKNQLQRQLEKAISNKQINLQEFNIQFTEQIQYYKRINRELDDRAKTYANKIIEMQGQMDIVKSQSQKIRRNSQNMIKDLVQSKQHEKQAKKTLKTKEQQIVSLEAEYSTIRQKSKNIDQIYKLETDKLKDEIQRLKIDLQDEYIKSSQLSQSNTQLAMQFNKLRIKLQFTQQRLEKDSMNLKDRQSQLENLIKDYEMQIQSLEESSNGLRFKEKEFQTILSKYEIDFFKNQENESKRQKQIKTLEEKCINSENVIRVKQQQINNLHYENEQIQKRLNQLQNEYNSLKNEYSMLNNERSKGLKIIQIYEQDLKKAKADIQSMSAALTKKQKQFQQQRSQSQRLEEQLSKAESKFSTLKKQTDRFRQSIIESINGSFLPVFATLATGTIPDEKTLSYRNPSSLNGNQSDKNRRLINESTSSTQIISIIISHSKDTKLILSRLSEQVRHLQKQIQGLTEEHSASSNKHQSSQYQLHVTIQQLQQQLSKLLTYKQEQSIKYDHMSQQMKANIKQKQDQINDLNQQLQELHFTLNSIKMDYDQSDQNNVKRISELKKQKNQLEERLQDVCGQNVELADSVQKMKRQQQVLHSDCQKQKQTIVRLNQSIQQLKDANYQHQQSLEQLKRTKKQLVQSITSLQLHLSSQSQLKLKTQSLLNEQQHKNQELRQFTATLIKQKENVIKSQIQKSQQLIRLETANIQLQRDKGLLIQQNQRVKKNQQQAKQQIKLLTAKGRQLQIENVEGKTQRAKTLQKIKDRQRQIVRLTEIVKKLQTKHDKLGQKSKTDKKSLEDQLQDKNQQLTCNVLQSSEKTLTYEKYVHQKQRKILSLENQIVQLDQQMFVLKQKVGKLSHQADEKERQVNEFQGKIQEQLILNQDLLDQIKQKEQGMFQLSGKTYNLELRLTSKQIQLKDKLQALDNQWIDKYQSICEEYEQRIQLVEKQRDYFKNVIEQKQQQIKSLKSQSKNITLQESAFKRALQDKIRKLEEDRLQLFTSKTNQIQKLSEQNKSQLQFSKQKQSESRRVSNQLEIARASIIKIQEKNKDCQQKLKNISKVYNVQLQQLKKKQQSFKGYKEWIINQQWSMERQVRKTMQTFIKKLLQNVVLDERGSGKIVQLVKNFEGTVIEAITNKLQQQ